MLSRVQLQTKKTSIPITLGNSPRHGCATRWQIYDGLAINHGFVRRSDRWALRSPPNRCHAQPKGCNWKIDWILHRNTLTDLIEIPGWAISQWIRCSSEGEVSLKNYKNFNCKWLFQSIESTQFSENSHREKSAQIGFGFLFSEKFQAPLSIPMNICLVWFHLIEWPDFRWW